MKLAFPVLCAVALTSIAVPAQADPRVTRHTSVTQVHGPVKLLPHHKRKYCKVVWKGHRKTKKCWYH